MLGFTPSEVWWARQGLNLRPHPCEGLFMERNGEIASTDDRTEDDSSANKALSSDHYLATEREKRRKQLEIECDAVMLEFVSKLPPRAPTIVEPSKPKVGTIYFIGPQDGPIKIGFASRLEFRLRDLQLANALPLIVHASVKGPPKLERDYHRQFAAYRLHGEWFERHPAILAEIERLNAGKGT